MEKTGTDKSAVTRLNLRKPCQARGQQRVDTILEAAGTLIASEGSTSGLTMHKLAEAAQTSIGSLYHFFPDKEGVIAALNAKHLVAFEEIIGKQLALPGEHWVALNPDRVIDLVFEPFFQYASTHSEVFYLSCSRDNPSETTLAVLFEKILKARLPGIAPKACHLHASVMESILVGASQAFNLTRDIDKHEWMQEIIHAQAAYLHNVEQRCRQVAGKSAGKPNRQLSEV